MNVKRCKSCGAIQNIKDDQEKCKICNADVSKMVAAPSTSKNIMEAKRYDFVDKVFEIARENSEIYNELDF